MAKTIKKIAGIVALEELIRLLAGPAVGLLEQKTASFQQIKPSTYISDIVKSVYAEPVPSKEHPGYWEMFVDEYYEKATPRDDIMPGMKVMPFEGYEKTFIKSKIEKPLVFKNSEFTGDYFGEKYGPALRKILSSNGIDICKLTEFLSQHRNEKAVGLYDDGFITLGDAKERKSYILKIDPKISKQINTLYFPPN